MRLDLAEQCTHVHGDGANLGDDLVSTTIKIPVDLNSLPRLLLLYHQILIQFFLPLPPVHRISSLNYTCTASSTSHLLQNSYISDTSCFSIRFVVPLCPAVIGPSQSLPVSRYQYLPINRPKSLLSISQSSSNTRYVSCIGFCFLLVRLLCPSKCSHIDTLVNFVSPDPSCRTITRN
jgi:hypothetical protein